MTRRSLFGKASMGLGGLALGSLLQKDGMALPADLQHHFYHTSHQRLNGSSISFKMAHHHMSPFLTISPYLRSGMANRSQTLYLRESALAL